MSDPQTSPLNVAGWLPIMAQKQPDALAVAIAQPDGTYDTLTCAELDALCDRAAHALQSLGIGEGTRTVLMVTPSKAFFALTFALFKLRAVPVMVDPGMGIRNLGQCLAEAQPEAFLGVPKAHAARIVLRWASKTLKTRVWVGPKPRLPWASSWLGHTFDDLIASAPPTPFETPPVSASTIAAILFTSGSTGVPKGAVYTHGIFSSQVRMLRDLYDIKPGEVDLSTFPLFALFGPALGMASVVPDMDASKPAQADPAKIIKAIEDFNCTNLFANPALVRKIGTYCDEQGHSLHTLKRVLSAGAPASPSDLKRLQNALRDNVEIFTPYGATESLPVASVGSHTILSETAEMTNQGKGVCVGTPVHELDVMILPINDDPIHTLDPSTALPNNEIGEIIVRGPVVTKMYWNRDASTQHAKIHDGDTLWHRMGDVGYLDDQGRLWMCGRLKHRVVTPTETLFTIPCEAIFNTHPRVFRSALVPVHRNGSIEPVICIELDPQSADMDTSALTHVLLDKAASHPHTHAIKTILYHPKFPVDVRHNAKIFREKLALWATQQVAS